MKSSTANLTAVAAGAPGRSILAAAFLVILCANAFAQMPEGVQTGRSSRSSRAMVTLALPKILVVNSSDNFVLDLGSTGCWGAGGDPTGYTFAVTSGFSCPGAGAQPDLASVSVYSTMSATTDLPVRIIDGGLTDLIPDIFTANRLQLVEDGPCGGGVKVSPFPLTPASANQVTDIPITGWSRCSQSLRLKVDASTPMRSGTATAVIVFASSAQARVKLTIP